MKKVWLATYPYAVFSTREAAEQFNTTRRGGVVQEVEMNPTQPRVYGAGFNLSGVMTDPAVTADWPGEGVVLHLKGATIWVYVRAEDKASAEVIAAAYFKNTVKPAMRDAVQAL